VEDIRQYLLTVIAAAILCAVVNTIMENKGTLTAIIKMLTGLFLAVTVLSPLISVQLSDFSAYMQGLDNTADEAVSRGEEMAQDAAAAIIIEKTEAYILDKAASLELDIEVEVRLGSANPLIPDTVYLRGSVSPYAKKRLCQFITDDLGIPEENQIWT